jgi:hypothetical protein
MSASRTLSAALLVVASVASRRAVAEPQRAAVEVERCPNLGRRDVERLLEIELIALARTDARIAVRLVCADEAIEIHIEDLAGDRSIFRSIAQSDRSQPADARQVALATSELLFGTWTDLRRPEVRSSGATPLVETSVPPFRLSAAGGLSLRQLDHPFLVPYATLRGEHDLDPEWYAFLEAGAEMGGTTRSLGTVRLLSFLSGAGLGWRLIQRDGFTIGPELTLSAGYTRLAGSPAGAQQGGRSVGGLLGRIGGAVVSAYALGQFQFALCLGAGYGLRTVEGFVVQDESVRPGGLYLAAGATIGYAPVSESAPSP